MTEARYYEVWNAAPKSRNQVWAFLRKQRECVKTLGYHKQLYAGYSRWMETSWVSY